MMLEIEEQTFKSAGRSPDLIIVPVGVGSLAQAVITYFKNEGTSTTVLTVEPETAACLKTSLKENQITTTHTDNTVMCGMNCGTVSSLAWPYFRDGVDISITVTDTESRQAQDTLEKVQIRTGPCSAGTLAALVKICNNDRNSGILGTGLIVILLGTEGPR